MMLTLVGFKMTNPREQKLKETYTFVADNNQKYRLIKGDNETVVHIAQGGINYFANCSNGEMSAYVQKDSKRAYFAQEIAFEMMRFATAYANNKYVISIEAQKQMTGWIWDFEWMYDARLDHDTVCALLLEYQNSEKPVGQDSVMHQAHHV